MGFLMAAETAGATVGATVDSKDGVMAAAMAASLESLKGLSTVACLVDKMEWKMVVWMEN
jgi:hypothetical protein